MKSVTPLGALNGLLESIDPFASYPTPISIRNTRSIRWVQRRRWVDSLEALRLYRWVSAIPDPSSQGGAFYQRIMRPQGVATRDMRWRMRRCCARGSRTTVEITYCAASRAEKMTLTRAALNPPPVTSS